LTSETSPFSFPKEIRSPAVERAFILTVQAEALLKTCATSTCYKCKGSGVSSWKQRGFRPVVCNCAKKAWMCHSGQSEIVAPPKSNILIIE
jgi:hypothetical protein